MFWKACQSVRLKTRAIELRKGCLAKRVHAFRYFKYAGYKYSLCS